MKKTFLTLAVLPFAVAGCTFSNPQLILPSRIRNVKIETFANKTILYSLEDKLYQEIYDQLHADGRLVPVTQDADAVLKGEIKKYELIPLSFDSNSIVEEYKLWMEVDIQFVDLKTGDVIFWEKEIPIDIRYYPPGSTQPADVIENELAAQERAVKELASEIVYLLLRYEPAQQGQATPPSFRKYSD